MLIIDICRGLHNIDMSFKPHLFWNIPHNDTSGDWLALQCDDEDALYFYV